MYEVLFLLSLAALVAFGAFRDKERKDRENHEGWISEVREHIHSIERDFHYRCQEIMQNSFLNHYDEIRNLKDEFINNLDTKVIERMGRYRISTVPGYLKSEYKRNISDIADTFFFFIRLMTAKEI